MPKQIAIGLVSLFLFGTITCTQEVPQPTMEEDKLIHLLADVHFAEAAMNNVYGKVKDSLAVVYYKQVYTIHGIDSAIFQEQITLLKKNPTYMKKLYEKVLTIVNEKEASLKEKK